MPENYYTRQVTRIAPVGQRDQTFKIKVWDEDGDYTHHMSVPWSVIDALITALATLED